MSTESQLLRLRQMQEQRKQYVPLNKEIINNQITDQTLLENGFNYFGLASCDDQGVFVCFYDLVSSFSSSSLSLLLFPPLFYNSQSPIRARREDVG